MRPRLATAATLVALVASTGGAIALGQGGAPTPSQGGAATAQYKPGKGCGKNHSHPGKKCPVPKGHNKPKQAKKPQKPKKAHRAPTKKPHPSKCKIRVVGQTLIAYCPNP